MLSHTQLRKVCVFSWGFVLHLLDIVCLDGSIHGAIVKWNDRLQGKLILKRTAAEWIYLLAPQTHNMVVGGNKR